MIFEWLLVAFITLFIWKMLLRSQEAPLDEDAPEYSKSLPIIGITHMLFCDTIKLWETMINMSQDIIQQGGVVKTRVGHMKHYFLTDPEDVATVSANCLEKHFMYNLGRHLLGQALLIGPVEIWKVHRKLLSPAFSSAMINGFLEYFNNHAKELIEEFDTFTGRGPFIATHIINDNIMKGVCATTVGDSKLHDKQTITDYSKAIKELSNVFAHKITKVYLQNDLIYKLIGRKKIEDELTKILVDASDKIVYKAKMAMTNQDRQIGGFTFLDKYLEIEGLTDKELRQEVIQIVIAAFDTTTVELDLILNLLGSHADVQERVYQEVISAIGTEKNVHKDDLQKLVYTDAVIKECIRLFPALPLVGRRIDKNLKLRNCTLRKGAQAGLSLYSVNRHPSWGPDADQFRPERWLEPGGVPSIFKVIPTFGIGKRNCIGKSYALATLKVYVAHIVRIYHIEADYTKLVLKWDLLLTPVKGHEISLKLRSK